MIWPRGLGTRVVSVVRSSSSPVVHPVASGGGARIQTSIWAILVHGCDGGATRRSHLNPPRDSPILALVFYNTLKSMVLDLLWRHFDRKDGEYRKDGTPSSQCKAVLYLALNAPRPKSLHGPLHRRLAGGGSVVAVHRIHEMIPATDRRGPRPTFLCVETKNQHLRAPMRGARL